MSAEESSWPILVALGITLSEVGVLFGIRPVSIGGLLVLVGTATGTLHESGYVGRPERAVAVQGAALVGAGIALVAVQQAGSSVRGQSIAIAGTLSLLAVGLWVVYSRTGGRARGDQSEADPGN